MEILTRDKFPPIGYNDVIRIALTHQNILRDIRVEANEIDLDNFDIEEMKKFVKFCRDKTE